MIFHKIKIDRILLMLIFTLLICYQILSYLNMPWLPSELINFSLTQNKREGVTILSLCSFVFVNVLFIYNIFMNKYTKFIFISTIVIVLFGYFWLFYSLFIDDININNLFHDPFSPISLISCSLILVSFNEKMWNIIKKSLIYISTIFIFLALFESLKVFFMYGIEYRIRYGGPMYWFIVSFYSFFGYVVFTEKSDKNKLLSIINMVSIILVSAVLQGRSWFLQTIFLFFIFIKSLSQGLSRKKSLKYIILILIFFIMLIYFYRELFFGLINRFLSNEDTRTGQLITFFEQIEITKLLYGQGMNASYFFLGDVNYKFIDNQVILFLFRYGIMPTICYCGFIFVPLARSIQIKNKNLITKSLVLISWFASMIGVSIYFNISFLIPSLLFLFYSGRIMKELSSIKGGLNEHVELN